MFTVFDILNEFVESSRLGRGRHDVSHTLEAALMRDQANTRARVLRAQHIWISNPVNREIKRQNIIAYRLAKKENINE